MRSFFSYAGYYTGIVVEIAILATCWPSAIIGQIFGARYKWLTSAGYFLDGVNLMFLLSALITTCVYAKAGPTKTLRAEVVDCIEADKCSFELELGFGVTVQIETQMCNIGPLREFRDQRPEAEVARWWALKTLRKAARVDLIFMLRKDCGGNGCEVSRFDRALVVAIVDNQLWNDKLVEEGFAIYSIDHCAGL